MKKLLLTVTFTIVMLALFAGVASAQIITVKEGENLWTISKAQGVSVEDLMKANDLDYPVVYPGDKLDVPGRQIGGTSGVTYTVVPGDSLWGIAKKFGLTVTQIRQANNLWTDYITPGQKLLIPAENATNSVITYTVVSGDTLWRIANKYGTTVTGLKEVNNLTSDYLFIGQKLVIPARNVLLSTGTLRFNLSQSQKDLLARVVMAEAGGEPYQGKVAVAAVVFNRIASADFPNTLEGVAHQRWAFESVENGAVWNGTPQPIIYEAVNDALRGSDPSLGATFFWNPYIVRKDHWLWQTRTITTQIGNHVFAQ